MLAQEKADAGSAFSVEIAAQVKEARAGSGGGGSGARRALGGPEARGGGAA